MRNIKNKSLIRFINQIHLHIMALPAVICLILFSYLPIYGLLMGFKDYKFNLGIWGSPWVGLKYFREIVTDPYIVPYLRNTVAISFFTILFTFPLAILFAMGINEVTNNRFRKTAQTITYMPHFISWVILSVMLYKWLSPSNGIINEILVKLGILKQPYFFLGKEEAYWPLVVVVSAWKGTGYSSVIFLSVIAGINPELYESAFLDGVNIFQKWVYITLPSILPTVMVVLILNMGGLVRGNFDISYLLGNTLNSGKSQIIETYVFNIGLRMGRFSYATAVGLLSGLASMLLVIGANKLSGMLTKESLF